MATAQAPKAYEVKEGAAQHVDITWANDITKVDLFIAGGLYEWKGTTHLAVPLVEPLSANIRKSSGIVIRHAVENEQNYETTNHIHYHNHQEWK